MIRAIVIGLFGMVVALIVLALVSDATPTCAKKCPHGGVLVKNYWGLPECICQGAP